MYQQPVSEEPSRPASKMSQVSDSNLDLPALPKDTPPEIYPILTLLTSHQQRDYYDGYFMLLNDLNTDGKPVSDRRWMEVYGKLKGTVLSIWDADSLNEAEHGEPTPTYINITDASFKSISTLPSPSGDLNNIVVLSTTSKNRFLLQFASPKILQDWTAALRLSVFEYTSLQEAYTGALLSAKGSKLNGIRTLLSETKYRHEDWVSVRFGSGMPWKKCWAVITPDDKKNKKEKYAPMGTIAFFEDKKKVKKPSLALVTAAYSAYAVYPQSSVLVNNSTLIKIEGRVVFGDSNGEEKESPVFIMPEPHPGVLGFETLIRFLIPCLDVFKLYGRPKRLNADKADMRSLLFGMPTLPRTKYLDNSDLAMIVGLKGSEKWTSHEWTKNIKDLLARKIATGYKGAGNVNDPVGTNTANRERSVSMPSAPPKPPAHSPSSLSKQQEEAAETEGPRPVPQANLQYNNAVPEAAGVATAAAGAGAAQSDPRQAPPIRSPQPDPRQPPPMASARQAPPPPNGSRPMPQQQYRAAPQPPQHQQAPHSQPQQQGYRGGPQPQPHPQQQARYRQGPPPPQGYPQQYGPPPPQGYRSGHSASPQGGYRGGPPPPPGYRGGPSPPPQQYRGQPPMGPPRGKPEQIQYQQPPRTNNRPPAQSHERSASEGTDPNNLMSTVSQGTQPISPTLQQTREMGPRDPSPDKSNRRNIRNSILSDGTAAPNRPRTPEDQGAPNPYVNGRLSPQGPGPNEVSPDSKRNSFIKRKPVQAEPLSFEETSRQRAPPKNIFDPTHHAPDNTNNSQQHPMLL